MLACPVLLGKVIPLNSFYTYSVVKVTEKPGAFWQMQAIVHFSEDEQRK